MISAEFRLGPQVHNLPQAILNVYIIKSKRSSLSAEMHNKISFVHDNYWIIA